nr:OmpA family protein [candidate division Zixibacteria bacterium]
MRKIINIYCFMLIFIALTGGMSATAGVNLRELETLYDSTRIVEAPIFAPKAFADAEKKLGEVRMAIDRKKKEQTIVSLAEQFREYAENALKITGVTKLSLSEYLEPRNKAIAAKAPNLAITEYQKAEEQFVKATRKVEDGDVNGGIKEAEKSVNLFDFAELQAIKADIMGAAARYVEKAVTDEATKYAPTSLDKARTAYTRCDSILNKDRYNRTESVEAIKMSEYEATHASSIAQQVRSLERNDQAWERLMLVYEIEMQKVGREMGLENLPFDNGPMAAAESLIVAIRATKAARAASQETSQKLAAQLKNIFFKLDMDVEGDDPLKLVGVLERTVAEIKENKDQLSSELNDKSEKLEELKSTHEQVTSELEERRMKEEKIARAKKILNPTEGEIFFNPTNDIVLRLAGLSFTSGSSDIKEEHIGLLTKVEEILEMFPDSKLMIEGHTDDLGDRSTNMRLSEMRAFSVMQYIRRSLSIPADKVSAVGYGPDKPVGTNTTAEGRAKNRRIDIIIFQ